MHGHDSINDDYHIDAMVFNRSTLIANVVAAHIILR